MPQIDKTTLQITLSTLPRDIALIIEEALTRYAKNNDAFFRLLERFFMHRGSFRVAQLADTLAQPLSENGERFLTLHTSLFSPEWATLASKRTQREAIAQTIHRGLILSGIATEDVQPLWSIQNIIDFFRALHFFERSDKLREFNPEFLNALARVNTCQHPNGTLTAFPSHWYNSRFALQLSGWGSLILSPFQLFDNYPRTTEFTPAVNGRGDVLARVIFDQSRSQTTTLEASPWHMPLEKGQRAAAESLFATRQNMRVTLAGYLTHYLAHSPPPPPSDYPLDTNCHAAASSCLDEGGDIAYCFESFTVCLRERGYLVTLQQELQQLLTSAATCWQKPEQPFEKMHIPASEEYQQRLAQRVTLIKIGLISTSIAAGLTAFLLQFIALSVSHRPRTKLNIGINLACTFLIPTLINMVFSYTDTSFYTQLMASVILYVVSVTLQKVTPRILQPFINGLLFPFLFVIKVGLGGWKECFASQAAYLAGKNAASYAWTKLFSPPRHAAVAQGVAGVERQVDIAAQQVGAARRRRA